jgi:hypothetical protein
LSKPSIAIFVVMRKSQEINCEQFVKFEDISRQQRRPARVGGRRGLMVCSMLTGAWRRVDARASPESAVIHFNPIFLGVKQKARLSLTLSL